MAVAAIAAATTSTAVLRPSAVAIRSASPDSPSVPAAATSTRSARLTAAPTEVLVEAIPEATPCSASSTPVPAAMNIVVKTVPSPMLIRVRPGTSAQYEPSARHPQAEHRGAQRADGQRPDQRAEFKRALFLNLMGRSGCRPFPTSTVA
jgi:hypothetical protein